MNRSSPELLPGRLVDARPDASEVEAKRLRSEIGQRLLGEEPQWPTLGRYVVLRELGAGGMGVVYEAYDPQLDRKIAVKLLEASGCPDARRRELHLREARALAKLSHPNVVAIHDAGTTGDDVWIAMEIVLGSTLEGWLSRHTHSWGRVVDVMVAAGRGLAAAHASGLVHRDFKPSNVMVGDDGRVRVLDFGLARSVTSSEAAAEAGAARTVTGLAGTLHYMAPELFVGTPPSPHSDQFAYCTTLREVLGEAGPRWLDGVIRRGVEPDPDARWPDMDALLDALSQGRRRVRRRWFSLVGGVSLAMGLAAVGWNRVEDSRHAAACARDAAALDRTWNDDVRGQLREALIATGFGFAKTTADKTAHRLDTYVEQWRGASNVACLAADPDPRVAWCLEERQRELQRLVPYLLEASAAAVRDGTELALRLPPIEECAEPSYLATIIVPSPAQRYALVGLRAEVDAVDDLEARGKVDEALAALADLEVRAREVGWTPIRQTIVETRAHVLLDAGRHAEAVEVAASGYFAAAEASQWDLAGALASAVLFGLSRVPDSLDRAIEWARHAEVALVHAGAYQTVREVYRLNALAAVHRAHGDLERARELLVDALSRLEQINGSDHPRLVQPMSNLAIVHAELGENDASVALLRRSLPIAERSYGPDHPTTALVASHLGILLGRVGQPVEGEATLRRALAIYEAAFGPDNPNVAETLINLAVARERAGDEQESLALTRRAVEILREQLPDHPTTAIAFGNLADALFEAGDVVAAVEAAKRGVEIRQRNKESGPAFEEAVRGLAKFQRAVGDPDAGH